MRWQTGPAHLWPRKLMSWLRGRLQPLQCICNRRHRGTVLGGLGQHAIEPVVQFRGKHGSHGPRSV